jgi:hypothetical protein
MDFKIVLKILTLEGALYIRVVDVVVTTLAAEEEAKAINDSPVAETIKATMEVCKIAGQVSKPLMANLVDTPIKVIFRKAWTARSHSSYHRTEVIIRLNFANTFNKATVLTRTNVHLLMVNKNLRKNKGCLCSKTMAIKPTRTNSLIMATKHLNI